MDENEKIRRRAHALWESEGRPEGRADSHWEQAREIVALEDGALDTALTPVSQTTGETVEPARVAAKHGEVPVLTDLGEENATPSRDNARDLREELPAGQRKAPAPRGRA